MGAKTMGYEKVLGEVIRDVRLHSGLTHETCAAFINASHLREIEKGLSDIGVGLLVKLCGGLGVTPSQLLQVVEARCAGQRVEGYLVSSNKKLRGLLDEGRFEPVPPEIAMRGIRGLKADATRDGVRRLKAEGLSKPEIAKKLGVTVRTIRRYWETPGKGD